MPSSSDHGVPSDLGALLDLISRAYSHTVKLHGPVAKGVCWKNADDQVLRYELLLQAIAAEDLNHTFTINDFGCGYGALFELLADMPLMSYYGYDISQEMLEQARKKHKDPRAHFIESPIATETADYSFVSGTYNMSFGAERRLWESYIKASLEHLWAKTAKVMAFNMLDNASPTRLDDLYYASRQDMIAFALSLSPDVDVVDDYPLDEFTIYVRRVETP